METLNWIYVGMPLLAYVLLMIAETIWIIKKPLSLQLSWEISHTLLIIGVNAFAWQFTHYLVAVTAATANALITLALLFLLRGGIYMMYYHYQSKRAKLLSWLYAGSNVLILLILLYVVITAYTVVANAS